MTDYTHDLVEELYNIKYLEQNDIDVIKNCFIDYLAASYAGYYYNRKLNQPLEELMLSEIQERDARVFLNDNRFSVRTSAFMNALYAHGAEMDDGSKRAMGHVGAHVISSVFALAEKLKSNWTSVFRAVAIGYEMYIRISSAAQPGMVERGFHSTGMAGAIACAAACAGLYGLDVEGMEASVGLATTMSCGLLSYGDSHPEIKAINPAKAAENGLFSAMMASMGIIGPRNSLEGPHGWFRAVSENIDYGSLRRRDHLLIHDCYYKLYPSCRHTHCGIDAAISIHDKVDYTLIDKVIVYIYPNAIRLAGVIRVPETADDTKFSIHYTIARSLIFGKYGLSDMDVKSIPHEVIRLIDKIVLVPDESMEDREKGIRGTRIEIITQNGSKFEETVLVPKGDPENPLSKKELTDKLFSCASRFGNRGIVEKQLKHIEEINVEEPFSNPFVTG